MVLKVNLVLKVCTRNSLARNSILSNESHLGEPGRSISGPPGIDGYPGQSGLPGAKGKNS